MAVEATIGVTDIVTAQLVECQLPEPAEEVVLPQAPESTPTQKAAEATISQTGADPPPAGDR